MNNKCFVYVEFTLDKKSHILKRDKFLRQMTFSSEKQQQQRQRQQQQTLQKKLRTFVFFKKKFVQKVTRNKKLEAVFFLRNFLMP